MFRNFFNGRYGLDKLSLTLLILAVILINIDMAWIAGVLVLFYAVFRILSKNKVNRHKELRWFEKAVNKASLKLSPVIINLKRVLDSASRRIRSWRIRFDQRKYYSFMRCPNCKNNLRLPRNKGKLSVTCPVCKSQFIKKT